MNRRKDLALMAAGILLGTALAGPTALAVQSWPQAVPSTQTFYLNGIQVEPEAYTIEGRNYVQLAELSELLGVAVSYRAADNSVHLSTKAPSDGAALRTQDGLVALPTNGSRYIPQTGDQIPCADGSVYRITDVSRWDISPFASGPLASLPEPTCDWTSFPVVDLPEPEVRRYQLEAGDYLFIRNIYECRRMQYTLMNLAGNHPETSMGGALRYGSKGTPYVRIQFGIPDGITPQAFWPWRESEVERIFNSVPPGTYFLDVWDVYCDGVYLRTEYNIDAI